MAVGARDDAWTTIAAVTRELAGDPALTGAVAGAIRSTVPEIGALAVDDVVTHTGLFVVAGLHAVAERRGPTDDELRFVAELASTRAGQGVPVTAMLEGIYAGQRIVWERAAALFARAGVRMPAVTEAFVSHLAWAKEVQATAIEAHRAAELEAARRERDARAELLRTLVTGPVHNHHVTELEALGLEAPLWVVHAPPEDEWPEGLELSEPLLSGRVGRARVAVSPARPSGSPRAPVALTGPAPAGEVPAAHRLAERVLAAAEGAGRVGLATPADFAFEIVLAEERLLGGELARSTFGALGRDDRYATELVDTLLAHLDHGARLEATAAALFVHPNTVRYRLGRLAELTGVTLPDDMDARVRIWWAARAWRAQTRSPRGDSF